MSNHKKIVYEAVIDVTKLEHRNKVRNRINLFFKQLHDEREVDLTITLKPRHYKIDKAKRDD